MHFSLEEKMKRIITLIMAVVMMACLSSVAFAADATLPADGLVANYSFDKAEEGLTVIGDASSITYKDGKAVFGGAAGLVSNLNMGELQAVSVVVTFDITADIDSTNWPFAIDGEDPATWGNHTLVGFNMSKSDFRSYASPKQGIWCNGCWAGYDKDVTDLVKGGTSHTIVVTVGYQENGTQGDGAQATGLFHALYIDGKVKENWCLHNGDDYNIKLSDIIGEKSRLFIGMSAFADEKDGTITDTAYDEFSKNISIDNLAVYNRVLTPAEVEAAVGAPATHTEPTVKLGTIAAPTFGATQPSGGATSGNGDNGAAQTGVATVALAIAALSSGAYVVSKKRH